MAPNGRNSYASANGRSADKIMVERHSGKVAQPLVTTVHALNRFELIALQRVLQIGMQEQTSAMGAWLNSLCVECIHDGESQLNICTVAFRDPREVIG